MTIHSFNSYVFNKQTESLLTENSRLDISNWQTKLFKDSERVDWRPETPPDVLRADEVSVKYPRLDIELNKRRKGQDMAMVITLLSNRGVRKLVVWYSEEGSGITNKVMKKAGFERATISHSNKSTKNSTKEESEVRKKVTSTHLIKLGGQPPIVNIDIGNKSSIKIEKFYEFKGLSLTTILVNGIIAFLDQEEDEPLKTALITFIEGGCKKIEWGDRKVITRKTKLAWSEVMSEFIIGIHCLSGQNSFAGKEPFNGEPVTVFYLPVKANLPSIDFILKIGRKGRIVKFSSKVDKGAASSFGALLYWAADASPDRPMGQYVTSLLSGTKVGEYLKVYKKFPKQGASKSAAYEFAFSHMGLTVDDAKKMVERVAIDNCPQSNPKIDNPLEIKVWKAVSDYGNGKPLFASALKKMNKGGDGQGNLCSLSAVVSKVMAEVINADSNSRTAMKKIACLWNYYQLHMKKTEWANTGTVGFGDIKIMSSGLCGSNVILDPLKVSDTDFVASRGFMNFRTEGFLPTSLYEEIIK